MSENGANNALLPANSERRVNGSGNTLEIADGGQVYSDYSFIGSNVSSSNNSVMVTGSGSVWSNHSNLIVGQLGSGNTLTVADGGQVYNAGASLGLADGSDNNSVLVTGNESIWSISDYLGVGIRGSGNMLTIEDGGRVYSYKSYIGWANYDNNTVLVSGSGSVWSNSHGIFVGYNGSNNTLTVENSAQVYSGNNSSIGRTWSSRNNSVLVTGSGSIWKNSHLQVGHFGSHNLLAVENGGRVESSMGCIGNLFGADSNLVLVTGANSIWQNREGLYVGGRWDYGGSGNSLTVSNGGWVLVGDVGTTNLPYLGAGGGIAVGDAGGTPELVIASESLVNSGYGYIGMGQDESGTVIVRDAGSIWNNSGDLYVGYNGSGALMIEDGGLASVGNDMHNRNHSTVSIDPGGHISISSNYYQDATSVLRFGVETNSIGEPLNALVGVGGTAEFEEGATLQYHSNVGVLDFDTFYTNLIVEADHLIVGGVTNANSLDLEAINLDGSLVDLLLWEDEQDIYGLIGRRYLAESAGFAPGSMMARLARELDDMSLLGNQEIGQMITLLNTMSSTEQNAQLTQRYAQGAPAYRHRQGMIGGQKQVLAQSRAFQVANCSGGARPAGAAGPHEAEQELRGWIRGYGSWADHDGTPSLSGFEQNVYGTVVGLDKAYGNVLIGAAGGYSRSDLTQDNADSSDARTGFGVLYTSFGSDDWFGDVNLGYGRSRVKTRSGTVLGGEGDTDAAHCTAYLGGGKEIKSTDGWLFLVPEAALFAGYYDQEGYNDGLMKVDAYGRWSFQSRLGATLELRKQVGSVVLKPELHTFWLHEFNDDPEQIGYSLIGGTGRYTFGVQAPDEDILEIGAGLSATFKDRLELVLDVDGQHNDSYKAIIVSARAVYEF